MAPYVMRITEEDLKRAAETAPERESEHAARMARDARERRYLDVDASSWRGMAEFYDAALPLLGIAASTDRSPGALVAAMVRGRTGACKPPHNLRISSVAALPPGLSEGLRRLQERVYEARTKSFVECWPTFGVTVELLPHRGLRASGNGRMVIDIDASSWAWSGDLYDAILPQLGAPDRHGDNMNALTKSIIWGKINAIEPPYVLRIRGTARLSADLIEELGRLEDSARAGRGDVHERQGCEVGATVERLP